MADFGAAVTLEVEADYHRFQLPEGCRWRDLRKVHENVGVALQNILDRIQQANPDTLAGIFGDVAWGNKDKLPEHALLNLIEAFHTLDLSPGRVGHDVLGNAYEYLLKQFADESGKKAGEFFTPRSVVRLLTRILDPQPTDTVYDPACGSGGMLVEAANEVLESGGSLRQMRFYGQEVNLTTAAIARMNLFLHDVEDVGHPPRRHPARPEVPRRARPPPAVRRGHHQSAVQPEELGVGGLEPRPVGPRSLRGAARQQRRLRMGPAHARLDDPGDRASRRRDAARRLVPGRRRGRHPRVPPPRRPARRRRGPRAEPVLLDRHPGLAAHLPGDEGPERRGHVLFVDGSKRFAKGRNQNNLRPEDVDALVEAYRTGSDPDGEGGAEVRLVPLAEIEGNGWDLNIGRYIKGAAAEVIDVETALAELAEAQQALHEAEERLAERLAEAGYA